MYVIRIRNIKTGRIVETNAKGMTYEQAVAAAQAKRNGREHIAYSVVTKG